VVDVVCGADERNPTHHVSFLDENGIKFGGILAETSPPSIQQIAPASTYHVGGGGTKFGDWEPEHSHAEQRTFVEGMGVEEYEIGRGTYFDGRNIWSVTPERLLPSMQWKFCDGIRTTHKNLWGDVEWQPLYSATRYVSHTFTVGASNLSADNVYILFRRRGSPGTLTVQIWTDSGGSPSSLVSSATATTTISSIDDYLAEWQAFDLSAAGDLTAATTYHVVVFGASTDNKSSHWEIGTDTAGTTSKKATAGSSWTAAGFDIYFRVTTAEVNRKWLNFELEGGTYVIDVLASGGNSSCYINGDRGIATSGTATTLVDSTKSWTADAFINAWVKITKGTGIGQSRKITDNTTTALTVGTWDINPGATSEYVIYKTDIMTAVSLTGVTTVKDVDVINNILYIAQGSGDALVRMRWNSATPGNDFSDDSTNLADGLLVDNDAVDGPVIWRWENDTVDVSRADAAAWGTDLVFGTAIDIGDDRGKIVDMAIYGGKVWVFKEDQAGTIENDRYIKRLDFNVFLHKDNGLGAITHDDYLWFCLGGWALHRYYGQRLDMVMPDLQRTKSGHFSSFIDHPAGLFAGLNAGDNGTSSIPLMLDDTQGWCPFYVAPESGQKVENIFWQVNDGTRPWLWASVGGDLIYFEMPQGSFNPTKDDEVNYIWEGVIEQAAVDFSVARLPKIFDEFNVISENLKTGIEVFVDYKVDDDIGDTSKPWKYIGKINESPHESLDIFETDVKKIRMRLRMNTNDADVPPLVVATVLEGSARTPFSFRYPMELYVASDQENLKGQRNHDPDEFLKWLKEKAKESKKIVMNSMWEEFDDIEVVIEPPSVYRDNVDDPDGEWSGVIAFEARAI
jgi:hypothetical protein